MNPLGLLIKLPAILLAITVHEYAHGHAALRLGDPTAKHSGRLTLNPIRHLDPMGFICLLLAGFGWAKPVPIDPRYFKNPLQGMMLSSLAGPMANMATAVACGVLIRFVGSGAGLLSEVLALCILYNVILALFNLLPVPPLDGSHVLKGLLPRHTAFKLMQHERTLTYGLFVVILLDAFFHTGILGRFLWSPTLAIYKVIGGTEGVLALVRVFGPG